MNMPVSSIKNDRHKYVPVLRFLSSKGSKRKLCIANITSHVLVYSHACSISFHEKVMRGLPAIRVYMFITGEA